MILMAEHHVTDYDAWKTVFDGHRDVQKQHGATGYSIYRSAEDPNLVTVLMQFPTREQMDGFGQDPSLAEAMRRGGVIGEPTMKVLTEAETVDYTGRMAA